MFDLTVDVATVREAEDHGAIGCEVILNDAAHELAVVDPWTLQRADRQHEIEAAKAQRTELVEIGDVELDVLSGESLARMRDR
jgi:hypothetical protein